MDCHPKKLLRVKKLHHQAVLNDKLASRPACPPLDQVPHVFGMNAELTQHSIWRLIVLNEIVCPLHTRKERVAAIDSQEVDISRLRPLITQPTTNSTTQLALNQLSYDTQNPLLQYFRYKPIIKLRQVAHQASTCSDIHNIETENARGEGSSTVVKIQALVNDTRIMTSQERKCFYWTIAVCLCLQAISFGGVHAQEQEDEARFDYGDGPNGPAHWGDLNVNWTTCKTGKYQSPMRITPNIMVTEPRLGDLDAQYSTEPVEAKISINGGYAVEVKVNPDSGLLKIDGVSYRPMQFHFHLGSEHKILGHSFPMELHLVHQSEQDPNKRAVIAWLFVKGQDSPFLAQFDSNLPKPESYPSVFDVPSITLPKLEKSFARYQGSLTTPPCTENVTWTVMLWNFPTISERQIQLFKAAMPKKNVRPSMPSQGRSFRIHSDS